MVPTSHEIPADYRYERALDILEDKGLVPRFQVFDISNLSEDQTPQDVKAALKYLQDELDYQVVAWDDYPTRE